MKAKFLVLIAGIALIGALISGCTEPPVVENQAPTASFTTEENIYVDVETTFTDASTDTDGTVESWLWDFGDNTNSTEQNPKHTYAAVDEYNVSLIVTDDDGESSGPYTEKIEVMYMGPTADYNYTPEINITANVTTVQFNDLSTKGDFNLSTWYWTFGDETNSSEQNPTHMFTTADTYTVSLTVTDENGATDTYSAEIEVIEETTT